MVVCFFFAVRCRGGCGERRLPSGTRDNVLPLAVFVRLRLPRRGAQELQHSRPAAQGEEALRSSGPSGAKPGENDKLIMNIT